jgi:pentapeptide MXKDX repeat protein
MRIYFLDIDLTNIDLTNIDLTSIDLTSIGSMNIDSMNIDSMNIGSMNIDSMNIDSMNIDSMNIDSMNIDSASIDSMNIVTNNICISDILSSPKTKKTTITKIYSNEGIFHLFNNTLHRMTINDGPINDGPINDGPINDGPINDGPINDGPINEIKNINKRKIIIDRSTISYEIEDYHLSPNHITEVCNIYTYSICNKFKSDTVIDLVIEKQKNRITEMYLVVDDLLNKDIVTFLSDLNLC